MTLAQRIKQARNEKGLTQQRLAERVGCKTQAVKDWEAGRRGPGRERLLEVAKALDKSADWLLGLDSSDDPELPDSDRRRLEQELRAARSGLHDAHRVLVDATRKLERLLGLADSEATTKQTDI